jgi:transcriptional regulator with XRE-family HTH domain
MSYVCAMFPDNRIRELRKKSGLSQAELGSRVGLHQTQIGNLENGGRNLTMEWARRIAKALDVTVADLLGDGDNPFRLTDEERALIANFRDAGEEQQQIIQRVAAPLRPYIGEGETSRRSAA